MHETIILCVALVLSVSFLVLIAQKFNVPYPIFLVLAGLLISFLPFVPIIHIDPNLVFLVILPPILFDAAQTMSLKALWQWRRIVTGMALGFVVFTTLVVAVISYWLIPGFTIAQGLLLGAIISPPDAAAATSVLNKLRLPKGMKSILEGESLLNDASSLTIYRFALMAIISNHFVWHEAALGFVGVVISGIGIGLLLGFLFYTVFKWMPTSSNLDIAFSIAAPYLIYMLAEEMHSSGVLAVVSGGVFIAYKNHFVFSHKSRLKSAALWTSMVFVLNAVVFFLIGLQLPEITKGIKREELSFSLEVALIITLAVIIARIISGLFTAAFTRFMSRYITVAQSRPGWRNPLVIGWVGMRGVVSLASALAIPLLLPGGQPFPHRNLILFITFVVIIITLVGQGLALPWVIRRLRPSDPSDRKTDDEQIFDIEVELNKVACDELEHNHAKEIEDNILLRYKLEFYKNKVGLLKEFMANAERQKEAQTIFDQFKTVMVEVTEAERSKLHTYRRNNDYDDDVIRIIENRLDLEEERLQEDVE
ncbi:Na+/H+ antiporter [Mucilaginibacter pallidiroseus]|uniref:Na+/H+ antiporter n=1 Tax=Mucilaginibacter pallidiroseus TaxID=2599295 RepID=A0A563U0Q7_9SPHI|nr:Na+/H+ antiporter [Mucilaginibacter pallidiroseus]TWR25214.1 Na+/H+ antiporter [Mucilaginibacter pallidiroseus]